MQTLIDFYKVHYNVGLFALLFVFLAWWLLTKGNIKWALIWIGFVLIYNVGVYHKTTKDPLWIERLDTLVGNLDVVDWLWGVSVVNDANTKSQGRDGN